jgi:hypothetical protein
MAWNEKRSSLLCRRVNHDKKVFQVAFLDGGMGSASPEQILDPSADKII